MIEIKFSSKFSGNDMSSLVKKYSGIYCFTSILYPFFWYYTGVYEAIPINIIFGVLFLLPLLFEWKKWFTTTYNAILIPVFGILEIFMVAVCTIHHTTVVLNWLIIIPLIAYLFFDYKKAILWTIPCLLAIMLSLFLNKTYMPIFLTFEDFHPEKILTFELASILGLLLNTIFLSSEYAKLRNKKEDTLINQNEELYAIQQDVLIAQKFKERFFTNMSHELRTPMNAIKGISELLDSTTHDEESEELITSLKKSSDHLLSIINDILDYSKINEGKLTLTILEFDVYEMLYSSFNLLKYNARQKSIEYRLLISPDLPKYAKGDSQRIRQVIINFLSNAIKFTKSGSVELHCTVYDSTAETFTLRVEVRDTGIGIANNNLKNLFQDYSQVNDQVAQQFEGTGLGLNISKKLIEMHQGIIGCTSELHKGSVFYFEVPLQIVKSFDYSTLKKSETTIEELVKEIKPKLKILIVDDNNLNLIISKKILHSILPSCNIEICEDGLTALSKTLLMKFDIILWICKCLK
ncbi:MAG: hypothetical protein RJA07_926 [Bacteroidota bacterium]|jgi:signal transduction histidine kinase